MTQGFLYLALNDPSYMNLAYNSIKSIKCRFPEAKATLIHDGHGITGYSVSDLMKYFEKVIFFDQSEFKKNDLFRPSLAKLKINLYTPYDRTIYIDADTLCSPYGDIMNLFSYIKEDAISLMWNDTYQNIDTEETICAHWQINSSFIKQMFPNLKGLIRTDANGTLVGFAKNEKINEFFNRSRQTFYAIENTGWEHIGMKWINSVSDEVCYELVIQNDNLPMNEFPWNCTFHHWWNREPSYSLEEYKENSLVSFPCGWDEEYKHKDAYNRLVEYYNSHFGTNLEYWKMKNCTDLWRQ